MAAMWSARVPRLPLSVECTVQLLQAQHEGSVSGYSLAVVRYDNSTSCKNKVLINIICSGIQCVTVRTPAERHVVKVVSSTRFTIYILILPSIVPTYSYSP